MAEITGAELQLDRFISADPDNGLLASLNSDATVSNLIVRSLTTSDVTWSAPANSSGTNTRRHLFDRPIVSTSTIEGTTITGTLATAAQPNVTSLGTIAALVAGTGTFSGPIAATGGQIAFPAVQVASADANTLDDYEEGTWTPTDASGAGLTLSTSACTYTKIGRFVFASFNITYPTTADATANSVGGLPFTVAAGDASTFPVIIGYTNASSDMYALTTQNTATFQFFDNAGAVRPNSNLSTKNYRGTVIYEAAN